MTEKRPPVVAIMGHIDHGKSTLLDYIRKSNAADTEAGGITQHLSAYEVEHKSEEGLMRRITFLDTPGHEAFQKMRERGASVADIAILVVSAEDSVKPQTLEALNVIKESKTPFIVAITKIDKPNANIDKVKQNLAENDVFLEGYGGSVPVVSVSGKTGEGIPELLDVILLVADIENLTGSSGVSAEGIVIESNRDSRKGTSATLIIKNGTLHRGDCLVAGKAYAPVRLIENFLGKSIEAATLGQPIRISGWSDVPQVGLPFFSCGNKKEAEAKAGAYVEGKSEEKREIAQENTVVIPIFIKSDVLGTGDAVLHEIKKIKGERVMLKIIGTGAGPISESDVKLASAQEGGIVLGFNVKVESQAKDLAERQGVVIQTFDIIYKLTEWLEKIVSERTPKFEMEEKHGTLKILKTFSSQKDKQVIGGVVEEGIIKVNDQVKVMRRGAEVSRGRILELQQQKIKTKQVDEGGECGVLAEAKIEIAPGDRLEAFSIVTK